MALRTIRIFISSPGDVAEERLIARRLIGRLDAQFGGALAFESVAWERSPLVATASFQEQLARPSDSDVVVVILWSRLGTVLPSHIRRPDGSTYASGTEFEFEDAVEGFRRDGRPPILAYLKTAPIVSSGDLASLEEATSQKRSLDRFVTRWFRNEADGTLTGAFHNFATPADFEDLLDAHLTRLAETFVPPGVPRASAPTWRGKSPFRGLQVFEPEHAPVFFGRTGATANVLSKLRSQGQAGRAFVLIVSMSGAGKSSLIRAGVLPLLLQPGVVGEATDWVHVVFRPSDGQGLPVAALARLVDGTLGLDPCDDAPTAETLVARVEAGLRRRDDAPAVVRHLALVVDQLEEIFTDDRIAAAERDAFFTAIDALARSGFVWILSSMRSDAYFRIAESPALIALKEGEGQFDLLPPTLREIGQIIRLPAAAAGLRFETRPNTAEKLDDVIRDASARNPGALPLLQFLLEELYRRRSDEDVLTFKAYEELGGVEGALAQHAEKVLADVSPLAQRSLSTVLRELVTFNMDDESRPLRRMASRDAFTGRGANELVDSLLAARLLVSASGADGMAVVSLAHEALLQFWPRVRAWVDEDRELLIVHARLEAATREWERHRRRPDLLLPRGKPLNEARELASAGIRLTSAETALLDASLKRARLFAIARNGGVAALALLTVAAGVAAWQATVERGRAQVQATTAQRTTDFMVSLFGNADPDQSKGDKVTVREVLDRGVVEIDRELKSEVDVRANLLRAMGQAYNGLGLFAKARQILQDAVSQSEAANDVPAALKARMALADNFYQDGDYGRSEELYRSALRQAEALYGTVSAAAVQATTGLAEALADDNKPAEAEATYKSALVAAEKVHGEWSVETARSLDGLCRIEFAAAHFDDARDLCEHALAIRVKLRGDTDSSVALSRNNLGVIYFQTGDFEKAIAAYSAALPVYRTVFGTDHPRVAAVLNNLGRVELVLGRREAAREHLTGALTIWRKTLSPSHVDLILALNSIAMLDLQEGRLDRARIELDEALGIARAKRHWMLNQVLGNEAELAILEGDAALAESRSTEARKVLVDFYGAKLDHGESWRVAILDLIDARRAAMNGDRATARRLMSNSFPLLVAHFGRQSIYAEKAERLSSELGNK